MVTSIVLRLLLKQTRLCTNCKFQALWMDSAPSRSKRGQSKCLRLSFASVLMVIFLFVFQYHENSLSSRSDSLPLPKFSQERPTFSGRLIAPRTIENSTTKTIAITILITSSHRTPDGIPFSIDGAFALKWSVLNVLQSSDLTVLHHQTRDVGLSSYSPMSAHRGDGTFQRSVTTYHFTAGTSMVPVEMRFVALVTPEVSDETVAAIEAIGFESWYAHSPVNASEIRNAIIRNETLIDGAMGIAELTKLEGLRMPFDKVLMVDCDVMFHRRFDELIVENRDIPLSWTKGGWESEKINGGFLVFAPRARFSRHHLDNIVSILREGDFRPGSGWKGKGIGWTYGGRTIQGVLPHYFFLEADAFVRAKGKNATTHIEMDRCRYNNMVQLPPCKAIPFGSVTSNHFTGDCHKPWLCFRRAHQLCAMFTNQWLKTYRHGLLHDDGIRFLFSDPAGAGVSRFASRDWVPSSGECPGGSFASLGQVLLAYPKKSVKRVHH